MKAFVSLFLGSYLLASVSPAFAAIVPEESALHTDAMQYADSRNILEPMSDGLMHPEMPLSRLDLVRSIVRDVYPQDIRPDCFGRIATRPQATYSHLFSDVSINNSSAKVICVSMLAGLIEGNKDGSFRAQEAANLVEAAKVISKAYGIAPLPSLRLQSGVPWHEPYWFALAKRGAIPESVKSRESVLTRGEFAEILYRLRDERPAQGFRYKSSAVHNLAHQSFAAPVSDSFTTPSVSASRSLAVLPSKQNLGTGLTLQMHAEERRIARLAESA